MLIYFAPYTAEENNILAPWHYWSMILVYNIHVVCCKINVFSVSMFIIYHQVFMQFTKHLMYVSVWAFLSRISDPRFGGMYIALFGAVSSIACRWPISICLWLVDMLTIQSCIEDEAKVSIFSTIECVTAVADLGG